jgi:hypothetical protein
MKNFYSDGRVTPKTSSSIFDVQKNPKKRKRDDTVQEILNLCEIPKIAKRRDNKSRKNSDRAWL